MTIRVAQYVRMSTERQEYSITLQAAAIAAYAAKRGYEVVRTYADEGVSGLTAEKRPGLQSMMRDVLTGETDFCLLLVYDVSRLGRFQNPDEAAHYEFLCNDAGVRIEYCAEQFANDGNLPSLLLKNIKRVMAAEYSRDLSAKVSGAQLALSAEGFWQGGPPGYGLRRQQVFSDGSLGRRLLRGDRKGPQCGRTILVPGPDAEVQTVRRIFDLYVRQEMPVRAIARLLNEEGVPGPRGAWPAHLIHDVLSNEKYVGTNIINKTSRRLGGTSKRQPKDEWVRTAGAFVAIVDFQLFEAAQARRLRLRRKFTEAEMLEGLVKLHQARGGVSSRLIDACPDLPSSHAYCLRFGSLLSAYQKAGVALTWRHKTAAKKFGPSRVRASQRNIVCGRSSEDLVPMLRAVLAKRGALSKIIIEEEFGIGAYSAATYRFGGGRRMYALVGYKPTRNQERVFDLSPSEGLTEAEAQALRNAETDGAFAGSDRTV